MLVNLGLVKVTLWSLQVSKGNLNLNLTELHIIVRTTGPYLSLSNLFRPFICNVFSFSLFQLAGELIANHNIPFFIGKSYV